MFAARSLAPEEAGKLLAPAYGKQYYPHPVDSCHLQGLWQLLLGLQLKLLTPFLLLSYNILEFSKERTEWKT